MIRILALSLAGAVVFVGASIPFLLEGAMGLIFGFAVIAVGSVLFWFVETATRESLTADTMWNRLMQVEGSNLFEIDAVAQDIREKGLGMFLVLVLAVVTIAWLGSLVHELFGRFWSTAFELGAALTCWGIYRATSGSSRHDDDAD